MRLHESRCESGARNGQRETGLGAGRVKELMRIFFRVALVGGSRRRRRWKYRRRQRRGHGARRIGDRRRRRGGCRRSRGAGRHGCGVCVGRCNGPRRCQCFVATRVLTQHYGILRTEPGLPLLGRDGSLALQAARAIAAHFGCTLRNTPSFDVHEGRRFSKNKRRAFPSNPVVAAARAARPCHGI